MPKITNKGIDAMHQIIKCFKNNETFSASFLSEQSNEKFTAATLNSLVNHKLLIKYNNTSPITYSLVENGEELFHNLLLEDLKNGNNNDNLHNALKNKDDEFYTYYEDVENELKNYSKHFYNKIIFLNCNDADENKSSFWDYFINNFDNLHLKKLIATSYNSNGGSAIAKIYDGVNINIITLQGNGDYNSEECLAFLKESDIVITNPPFSLLRKLVSLLIKYNKLFLLIGNENTFASTEMFPLIKDGKVWTGLNKIRKFKRPNEADREFGNVCWFTNLSNNKQNEELILTKEYSKEKYPVYDNYYTAINVDSLADIPKDYNGIMGVPVSYIGKYTNNQFKILGLAAGNSKANKLFYDVPHKDSPLERGGCGVVNGVRKFSRVFIQKQL